MHENFQASELFFGGAVVTVFALDTESGFAKCAKSPSLPQVSSVKLGQALCEPFLHRAQGLQPSALGTNRVRKGENAA